MNERIKELRMKVDMDMHLHNLEDIKAMEGCFGQEGGNKIVNEYIEKFAELIVKECSNLLFDESERLYAYSSECDNMRESDEAELVAEKCVDLIAMIEEHFGVEE